jgi:hypothetical protein
VGLLARAAALDRRVMGPVRRPEDVSTRRLAWGAGLLTALATAMLVAALATDVLSVTSFGVVVGFACVQVVLLVHRLTPDWSRRGRRSVAVVVGVTGAALWLGASVAEFRVDTRDDGPSAEECRAPYRPLFGEVFDPAVLEVTNACLRVGR